LGHPDDLFHQQIHRGQLFWEDSDQLLTHGAQELPAVAMLCQLAILAAKEGGHRVDAAIHCKLHVELQA
jgi:hypothetical protein